MACPGNLLDHLSYYSLDTYCNQLYNLRMALPDRLYQALPLESTDDIGGVPVSTTIYRDGSAFTYYESPGTGERQFVHTPDLVNATWQQLTHVESKVEGDLDFGMLPLALSHVALMQHGNETRLTDRERLEALHDTEALALLDRLEARGLDYRKGYHQQRYKLDPNKVYKVK